MRGCILTYTPGIKGKNIVYGFSREGERNFCVRRTPLQDRFNGLSNTRSLHNYTSVEKPASEKSQMKSFHSCVMKWQGVTLSIVTFFAYASKWHHVKN